MNVFYGDEQPSAEMLEDPRGLNAFLSHVRSLNPAGSIYLSVHGKIVVPRHRYDQLPDGLTTAVAKSLGIDPNDDDTLAEHFGLSRSQMRRLSFVSGLKSEWLSEKDRWVRSRIIAAISDVNDRRTKQGAQDGFADKV